MPKPNPTPKPKRTEKSCDHCRSLKYKCNPLPPTREDEAPQCERCVETGQICEYGDRGARRPSPLERKVDTIIDILLAGGAPAVGMKDVGAEEPWNGNGYGRDTGGVAVVEGERDGDRKKERGSVLEPVLEPMYPSIRDVVERGVLTAEEAEDLLQRYVNGGHPLPELAGPVGLVGGEAAYGKAIAVPCCYGCGAVAWTSGRG